jgi:hypothetical protein
MALQDVDGSVRGDPNREHVQKPRAPSETSRKPQGASLNGSSATRS